MMDFPKSWKTQTRRGKTIRNKNFHFVGARAGETKPNGRKDDANVRFCVDVSDDTG
jgi:hypothetical protein